MAALHRFAFRASALECLETRLALTTTAPTDLLASDHHAASREVRNIVYEDVDGRVERLDVDKPAGAPPAGGWPVLLAIHGGGWHKYDKSEYGPAIAGQFNPNGYVVVAVNYALATPHMSSWPASFDDVQNAVRWVRANAAAYGINPNEIAAIGESAGGNLAELLGAESRTTGVEAVVSFYGPSDLAGMVDAGAVGAPAVLEYLGGDPQQVPESYAAASPIDQVTAASAPMLLIQGTADPIVPFAQSAALAQALTTAGVANQLIAVPGATHGFEQGPQGRALTPAVLTFLANVWRTDGGA